MSPGRLSHPSRARAAVGTRNGSALQRGTRIRIVGLSPRVLLPGGLMNESLQTVYTGGGSIALEQRHRVLRNTYWLLALSLVPTVLGAWVGVSTGLLVGKSGGFMMIGFLLVAFAFLFAINKTKDSGWGVP